MIAARLARRSRSGFSLIEMLLVVVVVGIVLAIGMPRLRDAKIRSDVRSARSEITGMYAEARASAVQTGRNTVLNLSTTSVWITARPRLIPVMGSTLDTVGVVQNLFLSHGVSITTVPAGQLAVDPRGFGTSVATTIRVSNGGISDSIMVTGFGRVQR